MKFSSTQLNCYLIFALSLFAFTYGLFGRELIGFETRFGVFVQEMIHNGPSFFPTTYNQPYPDYPSLQTFLIYLLCLPFGKITVLTAILPSAIASSATLVLLYLLLEKFDKTWAYAAILLTILTYQFLDSARSLTMDPFIMLTTLWAFYATQRKRGSLWLALIFGFAIRGPIGLIIPSAVVGVTLWSEHNFKHALFFGIKSFILFIILMILLLIAAYHDGGFIFVDDVLRMQIFGRMNDHEQHHEFFDYFTMSFANYALSFELTLLTLLFFAKPIFRATTPVFQLLRQCTFWILIIMFGMSVPNVRKIRYIMPMIPALAILASYWWYQLNQNTKKIRVIIFINYFFLFLPVFLLIAIIIFNILAQHKNMHVNVHYLSAYCLLGILILSSIWILFHRAKTFGLTHPLRPMLIAAASLWVMIVFILTPIQASLNKAKPFVTQLLQQLPENKKLVFYQMKPDGCAIQVLLHANFQTLPEFAQTINWENDDNNYFLSSQRTFSQQSDNFKHHVKIIQKAKLGHQPMVVFCIKK